MVLLPALAELQRLALVILNTKVVMVDKELQEMQVVAEGEQVLLALVEMLLLFQLLALELQTEAAMVELEFLQEELQHQEALLAVEVVALKLVVHLPGVS